MKDNTAVGYIMGVTTQSNIDNYDAELHQIYVLPDAHRLGVGKQLVSALAKRLNQERFRSLLVWVMTINPAVRFYRDSLGGIYLQERVIPDGDDILKEAAYGWSDLTELFV